MPAWVGPGGVTDVVVEDVIDVVDEEEVAVAVVDTEVDPETPTQ